MIFKYFGKCHCDSSVSNKLEKVDKKFLSIYKCARVIRIEHFLFNGTFGIFDFIILLIFSLLQPNRDLY